VLARIVKESMRLYPPAYAIGRVAEQDVSVGGFTITKGTTLAINVFGMHRRPDVFPDPLVFDPDRFLPEREAALPRYAYLPFGAGPRTCIGLNFAMTEILVALTLILQRFQIKLAIDPATVRADPSVTLQPRPGVPVRLETT